MDAHVHLGVALHRAYEALVGLLTRLVDQLTGQKPAKQEGEQRDHQRTADELGEGELPAEQQRHDDAKLDNEIR